MSRVAEFQLRLEEGSVPLDYLLETYEDLSLYIELPPSTISSVLNHLYQYRLFGYLINVLLRTYSVGNASEIIARLLSGLPHKGLALSNLVRGCLAARQERFARQLLQELSNDDNSSLGQAGTYDGKESEKLLYSKIIESNGGIVAFMNRARQELAISSYSTLEELDRYLNALSSAQRRLECEKFTQSTRTVIILKYLEFNVPERAIKWVCMGPLMEGSNLISGIISASLVNRLNVRFDVLNEMIELIVGNPVAYNFCSNDLREIPDLATDMSELRRLWQALTSASEKEKLVNHAMMETFISKACYLGDFEFALQCIETLPRIGKKISPDRAEYILEQIAISCKRISETKSLEYTKRLMDNLNLKIAQQSVIIFCERLIANLATNSDDTRKVMIEMLLIAVDASRLKVSTEVEQKLVNLIKTRDVEEQLFFINRKKTKPSMLLSLILHHMEIQNSDDSIDVIVESLARLHTLVQDQRFDKYLRAILRLSSQNPRKVITIIRVFGSLHEREIRLSRNMNLFALRMLIIERHVKAAWVLMLELQPPPPPPRKRRPGFQFEALLSEDLYEFFILQCLPENPLLAIRGYRCLRRMGYQGNHRVLRKLIIEASKMEGITDRKVIRSMRIMLKFLKKRHDRQEQFLAEVGVNRVLHHAEREGICYTSQLRSAWTKALLAKVPRIKLAEWVSRVKEINSKVRFIADDEPQESDERKLIRQELLLNVQDQPRQEDNSFTSPSSTASDEKEQSLE